VNNGIVGAAVDGLIVVGTSVGMSVGRFVFGFVVGSFVVISLLVGSFVDDIIVVGSPVDDDCSEMIDSITVADGCIITVVTSSSSARSSIILLSCAFTITPRPKRLPLFLPLDNDAASAIDMAVFRRRRGIGTILFCPLRCIIVGVLIYGSIDYERVGHQKMVR
jgi:hypothetical protein